MPRAYGPRAYRPRRTRARSDPTVVGSRTSDREQEALIERLQQGDQQALAELYDQLGQRAFGLAYRVLGDAGAAEEAVQEAFLAVWRQASRLDAKRGRLEGFVLTVVHRRAIDLARARRRREAPLTALEDEIVDEQASAIFEQTARALTLETVVLALQSIAREQREAIELAFFEGLTAREIAERTGVPVGTVKSRLRLGMAKLRGDLGVQAQANG